MSCQHLAFKQSNFYTRCTLAIVTFGNDDAVDLLKDIDTEYCEIAITNGSITMKINAPDSSSKLQILHGKVLLASPVITKYKIVTWHLSGELADRLKINY
jgi:hypothetical protein